MQEVSCSTLCFVPKHIEITMTYTKLITVSELKSLLADQNGDVLLLDSSHDLHDAQAGRRAYQEGHIPNAYFISMDSDMSGVATGQNGRHPLPTREAVVELMQNLGAHDDTQIVICDRSFGSHASRVWWTLRWLGHTDVAVLDGGVQAWEAAGGELTQVVPELGHAGNFSDRPSQVTEVLFDDVLANIESAQKLVVDARSESRFRGENETVDPIGGHIPGAICRFYQHNLQADGTYKPADVLAKEFTELFGGRRAEDLIMQCGSGVSACHNLLALEVAGFGTAPLYIGSWSEWCSRANAPIATGD